MLSETIREFLRSVPFEPFIIQLVNGRRFEVPHSDFATVSPKGTSVFVFRDNDAAIHLNAMLIESVEPQRPATH
jgi:hypothetical protein